MKKKLFHYSYLYSVIFKLIVCYIEILKTYLIKL